jgi:hypothetical protein
MDQFSKTLIPNVFTAYFQIKIVEFCINSSYQQAPTPRLSESVMLFVVAGPPLQLNLVQARMARSIVV